MKKFIKILLVIIVAAFVIIQFIPSEKPVVVAENPDDLIVNHQENIPDNIKLILKESCYDCHSNETKYPWYSKLAPVKWLVYRDTEVGREELNLSYWEKFDIMDKLSMLEEMNEEIQDDEMPMKVYTITHTEAKLTAEEKKAFDEWIVSFMDTMFE